VVNANMCEALRIVSIERGHDPREFSLMAFGGAGPVHAAFLREELAVPEVVVPPAPGAFSALGSSPPTCGGTSRAPLRSLDGAEPGASPRCCGDGGGGDGDAGGGRRAARRRALQRSADCRYRRQAYELTVPMRTGR
jgi:N-methylhydantoinase A